MSTCAIRLENVSKFYRLYDSPRDRLKEALHPFGKKLHREFYAVKGVSLEIPRGEIVGLVGRNGSGKSTLLKIISGVVKANSGRVTVNGAVSAMLELGSGMNPDFDGLQNIYFGGIMLGMSREEISGKIKDIVDFADIGDFIRQPLRTYSSGMKARLGFALAAHINPEILVVDEVLAVGDDLFRRKCYARMESMMQSGCTVLIVSHAVNTINELCSRAFLLDRGELLCDGPAKTVTMHYQKLLFAERDKVAAVRKEIAALARTTPAAFSRAAVPARPEAAVEIGNVAPTASEAYFIPELLPKSTVVHRNFDADIANVRVLGADGRRLNVLVAGEEYEICFEVRFGVDATKVGVGVSIKSEKGVNLCNRNLAGEFVPEVGRGSSLQVRFSFFCNFVPGTYFATVNASMERDGKRAVLCAIQDALAFKVMSEKKLRNCGGIVFCNQRIEVAVE